MKVYFVGAGPGDPDLLTVKAKKLLSEARICIYAGSLVSPEVLDLLPKEAETYDSAGLSLDEIIGIFKEANARDMDLVRLHSGDPAIYGAISEQMNALDQLGIPYEVVPGISSFQAAAAALRTELTAPEIAQTVILTRTSGRTPMPKEQELEHLARTGATLCIFLSIRNIRQIADILARHYGRGCPASIVYRASWPDQKIIKGTLSDIATKTESEGLTRTAIIIVGWALSRQAPGSRLYDPFFTHEHRKGKKR